MMLPLFLKLKGREVLVVGGGRVAHDKIKQLLAAEAQVRVVAPDVIAEVTVLPITIEQRPFRARDLDGVWLAVVAATPKVNARVAAIAERRRIWTNVVDDADRASAYFAAVIRRGDATLAISTAGRAPALAALLREALEALLPVDLADWIDHAAGLRKGWREQGLSFSARRPLLLQALVDRYKDVRS